MPEAVPTIHVEPPLNEADPNRLLLFFTIEALASVAGSFLMVGIFFFTAERFDWGLAQNFALAAAQGAIYIVGALLAGSLASRFGRRKLLMFLYLVLGAVPALALLGIGPILVVGILFTYTLLIASSWPALESLVATEGDPGRLSRRLGLYNLLWSGTGALALAVNGAIIKHWPEGIFILSGIIHVACAILIACTRSDPADAPASAPHPIPERSLLNQRRLALVLSRIAMPASYAVIYSVSALMPLLPAVRELDPTWRTIVGSVWMTTRWIAFFALGATVFWHTRPRLLLLASIVMLFSFIGATLRPGDLFDALAHRSFDLAALIFWQAILGLALGLIYCASLYFGMVLSEGSIEHGGYHEALVGFGSVLGPGTGALALLLSNGNVFVGIAGVAGIISASVIAAGVAAARTR